MGLEGSVVDNLCKSGHNLRRRLPDISGCFTLALSSAKSATHEYQDWQSLNQRIVPMSAGGVHEMSPHPQQLRCFSLSR